MMCVPDDPHDVTASDARALRHHLGDSRLQFALRLGISPQAIENWERGIYEPSWRSRETLFALARTVCDATGGDV